MPRVKTSKSKMNGGKSDNVAHDRAVIGDVKSRVSADGGTDIQHTVGRGKVAETLWKQEKARLQRELCPDGTDCLEDAEVDKVTKKLNRWKKSVIPVFLPSAEGCPIFSDGDGMKQWVTSDEPNDQAIEQKGKIYLTVDENQRRLQYCVPPTAESKDDDEEPVDDKEIKNLMSEAERMRIAQENISNVLYAARGPESNAALKKRQLMKRAKEAQKLRAKNKKLAQLDEEKKGLLANLLQIYLRAGKNLQLAESLTIAMVRNANSCANYNINKFGITGIPKAEAKASLEAFQNRTDPESRTPTCPTVAREVFGDKKPDQVNDKPWAGNDMCKAAFSLDFSTVVCTPKRLVSLDEEKAEAEGGDEQQKQKKQREIVKKRALNRELRTWYTRWLSYRVRKHRYIHEETSKASLTNAEKLEEVRRMSEEVIPENYRDNVPGDKGVTITPEEVREIVAIIQRRISRSGSGSGSGSG